MELEKWAIIYSSRQMHKYLFISFYSSDRNRNQMWESVSVHENNFLSLTECPLCFGGEGVQMENSQPESLLWFLLILRVFFNRPVVWARPPFFPLPACSFLLHGFSLLCRLPLNVLFLPHEETPSSSSWWGSTAFRFLQLLYRDVFSFPFSALFQSLVISEAASSKTSLRLLSQLLC